MSYSIKNSSQSVTYLINDNTENTTDTSLTLIGKNYATYGAALNQNFLYLIENFANNIAPPNPITGQIWWDNFRNYLNIYDGTQWQTIFGSSYATLVSNTYVQAGTYIQANSYITAFGNINTPSLRATNIGNISNSNIWGNTLTITANAYANAVFAGVIGNTGSLIQGTVINANSGTLTTLSVSGVTISGGILYANSGTLSSSTSSGALVVTGSGGIGVGGRVSADTFYTTSGIYYSNGESVFGAIIANINNTSNIGSPTGTAYAVQYKTPDNLFGGSSSFYYYSNNSVVANSGTSSTGTTSGAMQVVGGLGISGNIFTGGLLYTGGNIIAASGTASSNSNTAGAIVVSGGIGISGNINTGGVIRATGNIWAASGTAAITTTTGSIVSTGGIGLSGALVVGSGISMQGNAIIFTDQTTGTIFNTGTTTLNIGGAATTVAIGATSGTMTLNNPTIVGSQTTQNLFNTVATTLNIGGAATSLAIGATSGTMTLNNPTIVGSQTTQNLFNTVATTLNIGGAATTINLAKADSTGVVKINGTANSYGSGQGALQISGGFYASGDSYIRGNLVVANLSSITFSAVSTQAPLLYLQSNGASYNYSIGFYSNKRDPNYNHTGFVRNHSDNQWYLFSNIATEPTSTVDLANTNIILDTVRLGGIIAANTTDSTSSTTGTVTISGGLGVARTMYAGSIQNTPIGNATPSTGAFSNIMTTNGVFYPNGISFASPPQGISTSVQFNDGGFTFGGATYLQYFKASGNTVVGSGTTSSSATTGALVVNGGAGVTGSIFVGSTVSASIVNAGTIGNSGAVLTGTLSTAAQTNVTSLGTLTGLTMSGAIVPSSNATVNLGGASSQYFNNVYSVNFIGTSATAKYADLAEKYESDADYEAGTVVIFGGDKEITVTDVTYDDRVAGVISANPAFKMNSDSNGLYVALQGRVPCKVRGPVYKGQQIVTSNIPGVGQGFIRPNYVPGSVIGKSLETITDDGIYTIEIVVGRV